MVDKAVAGGIDRGLKEDGVVRESANEESSVLAGERSSW